MTGFVPSQTLISMYFVVVPTQCKNRDLPVKSDKRELDSHREMRRSKENRNHMLCLKYIVPVLQSLSLEIHLPCIILIFLIYICLSVQIKSCI